jgi:cyclopropane fatty-acyl-phospholipid synthase-like methyltransferase
LKENKKGENTSRNWLVKSMANYYGGKFYDSEIDSARRAAKEIIPMILELISPKSVIDIGCGAGSWLASFKEHGVEDILGVDGEWVKQEKLQIPKERFVSFNLTRPFRLNKKFDLVMSLEVAEHIPAKHADTLIDTLVNLGPLVLFSAAIPFQEGTRHVNEQWPSYWAKKFSQRGYVTVDCVRKKIWLNQNIDPFYAQNMFIFAKKTVLEHNQLLKEEFENTNLSQLSLVHPRVWLGKTQSKRSFTERLIQTLHRIAKFAVRRGR